MTLTHMRPEREPDMQKEEAPKKEERVNPPVENAAPGRLRPDKREDEVGDRYRQEQAEIVHELAELKSGKDAVIEAYEKDLARLSKDLLEASAEDPHKVDEISEGIKQLNAEMDEHRKERKARIADLEAQLSEINTFLNPLEGLSEGETEEALSNITFAEPITEKEAEKALEPLKEEDEIIEVTDDMIVGPAVERHGEFGKGKLTGEQKAALREEAKKRAAKKTTGPELQPELIPGAREASRAEYELTGDEFEVEPSETGSALPDANAVIETLAARAEEPSEVLPALSPEQQEARDLGDEDAVRMEVAELQARVKEMYGKGFSQENLDRLMVQKRVDPDKRAASGMYRARTMLRSLLDPKLRLLLRIYDDKTSELADLKDRIATGTLRLEDPEAYKKLMKAQHERLQRHRRS